MSQDCEEDSRILMLRIMSVVLMCKFDTALMPVCSTTAKGLFVSRPSVGCSCDFCKIHALVRRAMVVFRIRKASDIHEALILIVVLVVTRKQRESSKQENCIFRRHYFWLLSMLSILEGLSSCPVGFRLRFLQRRLEPEVSLNQN